MKWERHFLIGLIFALLSGLFFFVTGASCVNVFGQIAPCGYKINYETLSIGSVLAFIASCEFVLVFKRKNGGELFWESYAQRLLRRSGVIAMIAGTLATIFAFFRTENTTVISLLPWNVYGFYGATLYAGLIVVSLGMASILGSRFIKIKPLKSATAKLLLQQN